MYALHAPCFSAVVKPRICVPCPFQTRFHVTIRGLTKLQGSNCAHIFQHTFLTCVRRSCMTCSTVCFHAPVVNGGNNGGQRLRSFAAEHSVALLVNSYPRDRTSAATAYQGCTCMKCCCSMALYVCTMVGVSTPKQCATYTCSIS